MITWIIIITFTSILCANKVNQFKSSQEGPIKKGVEISYTNKSIVLNIKMRKNIALFSLYDKLFIRRAVLTFSRI